MVGSQWRSLAVVLTVVIILLGIELDRYVRRNSKLTIKLARYEIAEQAAAIAKGRVLKGMVPRQCEQAWGKPTRVNQTDKNEEWFYESPGKKTKVLVFRDRRLHLIQE